MSMRFQVVSFEDLPDSELTLKPSKSMLILESLKLPSEKTCGEINTNTVIDGQRNNMESLLVPFMSFSEIKFENMRTESKPLVTSEHLEHFEYQTEQNMKTFPPPKQKKHQMGWWHHPKDFAFCSCLILLFLCVGFCAQIGFAFC